MDLTDFQYMPLYIARLQRSKAWLRCKRQPELAFYMLNLWLRSWHEIPAGTIEDDDDVLADAAMCSPDKWEKIKAKVLAGWEVTEDGRLRHPVVNDIALASWTDKQEYRRRKEEERLRKAAKRSQPGGETQPDKPDLSGGHPADTTQTVDGIPAENALKGEVSKGKGHIKDARPEVLEPDEKQIRNDQIRAAMNIDPEDDTWTAIKAWLEVWHVRGADFRLDVLATVMSMMAKKPKTFTPNALIYFDATIQQNFDARIRRNERPAPQSTLPPAEFDPEAAKWEARLGAFKATGTWTASWGAKPGEPGCQVPAKILELIAA